MGDRSPDPDRFDFDRCCRRILGSGIVLPWAQRPLVQDKASASQLGLGSAHTITAQLFSKVHSLACVMPGHTYKCLFWSKQPVLCIRIRVQRVAWENW